MRKARESRKTPATRDDLATEYHFDYAKSRPNRFAGRVTADAVMVVLDPDVAEVFGDSDRVNSFLRAAINAVEGNPSKSAG